MVDIKVNMIHIAKVIHMTNTKKPSLLAVARNLRALAQPIDFDVTEPTLTNLPFNNQATGKKWDIAPNCDVYLPNDRKKPFPTIVFAHGGAFLIGSKTMRPVRYLVHHLVQAGYGVCAIDYRMAFRGGRIEAGIDDVAKGIKFWSDECERFGGDPQRMSVLGVSAGATLSLLALADNALSARVHKMVSVFGLYNMAQLGGPLATVLSSLVIQSQNERIQERFSPLFASPPACPVMLMHGADDGLVPVEQAHQLAMSREQLGLPTQLTIYNDQPHGFFNYANDHAENAATDIVTFLGEAN